MRYVAFDIESTDGAFADGNLCEFGYVVADSELNIIEQRNILVRPLHTNFSASFHVKLSYPLAMYKEADRFVDSYEHIYNLLTADDVMVVGHAIHNDIVCINSACRVNTLPVFSFRYIDTQLMYMLFAGKPNVQSLEKIAEEINEEFTAHRADEDARMSLLTLKYIMREKNMTFEELMADMDATIGVNDKGDLTGFCLSNGMSTAPSINSKNSKRRILSMFTPVRKVGVKYDQTHALYHKKVYLDSDFMLEDIDVARAILQKLADVGAKNVRHPMESDYLVCYDGNLEDCNGEVIDKAKLDEMLGEYEVKSYDDEQILRDYLEAKRERRALEKKTQLMKNKAKLKTKKVSE